MCCDVVLPQHTGAKPSEEEILKYDLGRRKDCTRRALESCRLGTAQRVLERWMLCEVVCSCSRPDSIPVVIHTAARERDLALGLDLLVNALEHLDEGVLVDDAP